MATDVFSRDVSYGGSFSADGAAITFANFGPGVLVQNIQYQYQQAITRLYEVGSPLIYLVAGRTQGQVSLARVMGPVAITTGFYQQFGNVCNAAGNSLSFQAQMGCGTSGGGTVYTIGLHHCVISQLGGSVSAQDMVINESLAMMFLYMLVS
jgi:hypothetical protein